MNFFLIFFIGLFKSNNILVNKVFSLFLNHLSKEFLLLGM